MQLLNKRLKYNLHYKHKDWIKTLAIKADAAISKLHERDQKYRTISSNIQKLINKPKKQTET
jgi:hypothetical protein